MKKYNPQVIMVGVWYTNLGRLDNKVYDLNLYYLETSDFQVIDDENLDNEILVKPQKAHMIRRI